MQDFVGRINAYCPLKGFAKMLEISVLGETRRTPERQNRQSNQNASIAEQLV